MSGVQRARSTVPPLGCVAKRGARDSYLVEAGGVQSVKRLNEEVTRQEELTSAGGTNCDVWVGRWRRCCREGGGREEVYEEKVALKMLRASKASERALKRLESELPRWAELHHQNVLPFYGIITDLGPRLYMVSPWRESGNLLVHVRGNPGADKNYLLCGSAAGLNYLHSRGVVHGGVRCNNVLISLQGEPQICDFGLTGIAEESAEGTTPRTASGGVVRYLSSELIENNNAPPTIDSDVYSFAMLMLECITEKTPFSEYPRDAAVIHARITKGQCCPLRPNGPDPEKRVSDRLWDLMLRCWSAERDRRPTMRDAHRFLLH